MENNLTIPQSALGSNSQSFGQSFDYLSKLSVAAVCAFSSMPHDLRAATSREAVPSGGRMGWVTRSLSTEKRRVSFDQLYLTVIENTKSVESEAGEDSELDEVTTLLELKQSLSLTGEQLAKAMNASRGAVYKWLDGTHEMKPANAQRLEKLRLVSSHWSDPDGRPLSRVRAISRADRLALYTLLEKDDLTEAAGELDRMSEIAKANPRREGPASRAKKYGWEPLPEHVVNAQVESAIPSAQLDVSSD